MIASTLLDVPRTRKGTLALQADEYLARFLEILTKLERAQPAIRGDNYTSSGPNHSNDALAHYQDPSFSGLDSVNAELDEEFELRHWADLSEYQAQFIKSGGFFG